MSEEIKVNRPVQPMTPMQAMPAPAQNSKMPWFILAAVVILIVVLGIVFRGKLFGAKEGGSMKKEEVMAKASGYQAIFLSNGQVYFGKLSDSNSTFATMTDVFYLQVVQPPLQGQQEAAQQQQQQQQQPQISLVKLGNELHGPLDEMKINRDHILFYENLKEEGQVIKAIKDYKANPQGSAAQGEPKPAPVAPVK